jgi:DNA primase
MARLSQEFLERVRQANLVEQVVSERVKLTKAGKNLKGLCPFHNEKTPSFTVAPDKGIFHCFGCQKGGNVYQFIMEYEGVSFVEAVELLAERAGIPMEAVDEGQAQRASAQRQRHARLLSLCRYAQQFFEQQLYASDEGRRAQEYMRERQISEAAARAFRLGYAPDRWQELMRGALQKGFTEGELVQAGLAIKSEEGESVYDRFRGRLVFPIWDLAGNVIAFGGRVIGDGEPKYLNSPETPIYVKSRVLYPIHLTKRAIQQKGLAVLCEGYMDAMTLAQYRFTYCVASCGTALTADQAQLLRRFARKVVVAYDGDTAGQEASLRSISVLLAQGIDVFIAGLGGGEDPDSYLKRHGAEAFTRLIDEATPFFTYLLRTLSERIDTRTPQGKDQLCREVFPLLGRLDNEIVREGYLDELAGFVDVDRQRVARAFGEVRRAQSRREPDRERQQRAPEVARNLHPAERELLGQVLRDNEALEYAHTHLDAQYMEHPTGYAIIKKAYDACQDGTWPGCDVFLTQLSDEEQVLVTDLLCRGAESSSGWKPIVDDCITMLHNRAYEAEIARLKLEMSTADGARQTELLKAIQDYQRLKQPRVKRLTID